MSVYALSSIGVSTGLVSSEFLIKESQVAGPGIQWFFSKRNCRGFYYANIVNKNFALIVVEEYFKILFLSNRNLFNRTKTQPTRS